MIFKLPAVIIRLVTLCALEWPLLFVDNLDVLLKVTLVVSLKWTYVTHVCIALRMVIELVVLQPYFGSVAEVALYIFHEKRHHFRHANHYPSVL